MTLARGTDRLESARLVLRRVTSNGLPFYTRLHALPNVAQLLYPGGRPRSPEETAAWLKYTLASYEQWALGYLAVLRKEDGALIGRCGLMDMVVESAEPEHGIRRGWFGREQAPADVALLRWPYVVSTILPQNGPSRRVAERGGAQAAGQMHVVGLTGDRWVWPLHDTRIGH
jgi:RimJ/RimL family protein N-acetyltransferase